jgi:putative ABC transport system ATP-binding protein
MEILRTEHLTKIYGTKDNPVTALNDVYFSVAQGEFVAVVGSSGSGKSTLLHMLGGVDRPTSGRVLIEDQDIYQMKDDQLAIFRRRQVGLIYQFFNLIPVLNVEENMTLPVELDGGKPDTALLHELIETLGLGARLKHLPNELSGGQQQRVAIGRALMNRPAILLADEPTGNLDSKASDEIVALLKLFHQKYKQTIIMITHDMEIAKQADRIVTIEDGRIVRDTEQMCENKQVEHATEQMRENKQTGHAAGKAAEAGKAGQQA